MNGYTTFLTEPNRLTAIRCDECDQAALAGFELKHALTCSQFQARRKALKVGQKTVIITAQYPTIEEMMIAEDVERERENHVANA